MVKHSLVVPCFNEEGNIEPFLNAVKDSMKGYTDSYEIVFINDGSKDKTGEVLKRIYNENKNLNIKVVNFSRNFGKESAIFAGLTYANGEYITLIDADLQQDPLYAVQMGRILDENPDCDIVAAYQEKRRESKFIILCKNSFYKLINKITEVKFIENSSDFRTFRKCVADTILSLSETHRFSKGIFSWVGYNTISIPYEVKDRQSGESKWNFIKLLKYALEGIVAYTDMPLKIPFYFGVGGGLLSILMFIVFFIIDIATVRVVTNYYLCAFILLLASILSVFQGIIGFYLGKVHSQVKNRPIFIVRDFLTYEKD